MKTIWRYNFILQAGVDRQVFSIPMGCRVLTAQAQDDYVTLWAEVMTENDTEEVEVQLVGTGTNCDDLKGNYLSTVQLYDGRLVLHVFIRYIEREP